MTIHAPGPVPGPGLHAMGPPLRSARGPDEGSGHRRRPDLVRRRLLEPLDRVVAAGGVAVLVGPAGSGKSVLLEQWLTGGRAVSFVGSCRSSQDVEVVARWCAADDGGTVVVDDVDLPAGTPAAQRLVHVVRARPRGVTLVLGTRRRWMSELAREPGDVVLGAAALAFTRAEVEGLLESVGLAPGRAEDLVAATQGWAITVHLAALAMRSSDEPDAPARLLCGADRHFDAFVLDGVLGRESARARHLLRRCAALDVLHIPLCARIWDPASDAILRGMAARSVPLEECRADPSSFTLHPLLRDVLLRQLRALDPSAEDRALAAAAAWYRRRGLAGPAAQILIRTQRWDALLELVDDQEPVGVGSAPPSSALDWLDAIPTTGAVPREGVVLRRAALLTLDGHTARATNELHALDEPVATHDEMAAAETIRACWVYSDGAPAAAEAAADRAIELLDRRPGAALPVPHLLGVHTSDQLRCIARGARARSRWLLGDVEAARAELVLLARGRAQPGPLGLAPLGALALLLAWCGEAAHAQVEAQRTLAAHESSPWPHDTAIVDARLALAHIHRERGDLALAWQHLRESETALDGARNATGDAVHAVETAQLLLASAQPGRALEVIDAHRVRAGRAPLPIVDDRLHALQIQGQLAIGAPEQARALAHDAPIAHMEMSACAAAQVALACGDLAEATEHLSTLATIADPGPTGRIQHCVLSGVVHQMCGDRDAAVAHATRAVQLACETGNVRTLIDLGQPAVRLLRMAQRSDPTEETASVLALASRTGSPLSARELEVIRFLPTSLPSAQIAAALYISLNTLKTHLASIYRKLGVTDRTAATQRAMEMGLA